MDFYDCDYADRYTPHTTLSTACCGLNRREMKPQVESCIHLVRSSQYRCAKMLVDAVNQGGGENNCQLLQSVACFIYCPLKWVHFANRCGIFLSCSGWLGQEAYWQFGLEVPHTLDPTQWSLAWCRGARSPLMLFTGEGMCLKVKRKESWPAAMSNVKCSPLSCSSRPEGYSFPSLQGCSWSTKPSLCPW